MWSKRSTVHAFSALVAILTVLTAVGCAGCGSAGEVIAGAQDRTPSAEGDFEAPDLLPLPSSASLTYRGMTFAHEGYDGQTGYGGASVGPSLDSLAALGINAVAIVPYTFMRGPDAPGPLPIPTRLGTERDAAVAHAVGEAHARGWAVLLKPQIWLGGGHWPGDVDFGRDEDAWQTWLEHYRDYILHYARFAERHQVEALCLGTELVRATLTHPDAWRGIAADVREVYGGKVTYAANWGEEFENLAFWDALDAVGLNSYYPLSRKPDATDAELHAGARAWMTRANNIAAAAGKPLWLTEVGYRSAEHAWLNPHAAPEGRPVSEACQRRCYRAMLAATAEAPLLDGMFVWKWPSYLGRRGGHHWGQDDGTSGAGFTPGGKQAAEVLTAFYRGGS